MLISLQPNVRLTSSQAVFLSLSIVMRSIKKKGPFGPWRSPLIRCGAKLLPFQPNYQCTWKCGVLTTDLTSWNFQLIIQDRVVCGKGTKLHRWRHCTQKKFTERGDTYTFLVWGNKYWEGGGHTGLWSLGR